MAAKPAGAGAVPAAADKTASGDRRSPEKRRRIAEAAAAVFLHCGYERASVDIIAAKAGVAKQTVYSHFGCKERLFLASLEALLEPTSAQFAPLLGDQFGESGDLRDDLLAFARAWLGALLRPEALALRRLVIAEVGQFPQLGQTFLALGPSALNRRLGGCFERLTREGKLRLPDDATAALQFAQLVLGWPQTAALFGVELEDRAIDDLLVAGVDLFLAAYGAAATGTAQPEGHGDAPGTPRRANG